MTLTTICQTQRNRLCVTRCVNSTGNFRERVGEILDGILLLLEPRDIDE